MEHKIYVLYHLHVKLKFELVIKRNKKIISSDLVYKHKCNEFIGGRYFLREYVSKQFLLYIFLTRHHHF